MTSPEPRQKRSNRPLTQFTCRLTEAFLQGRLAPVVHSNGNTSVAYEVTPTGAVLKVQLFDRPLLSLFVSAGERRPLQLLLCMGTVFDGLGRPTRTTVERLNGLLDCLGFHGVIPDGVRVFRTAPDGSLCLGRGDSRLLVGRQFATEVLLRPDPEAFIVEATGSLAVPLQLEPCATA